MSYAHQQQHSSGQSDGKGNNSDDGTPKLRKNKERLTRQVTVKNLPHIQTWEDLRDRVTQHVFYTLVRDRHDATNKDIFTALALSLRDQMAEKWIKTRRKIRKNNERMVYYISMEFYLGRMMKNAIINLGLEKVVDKAAKELGFELKDIFPCERDAGLGNGGLGRLAACFLDSMATLDIPCIGYGLRYEYGIFEQVITPDGDQTEKADDWLEMGYAWEVQRCEDAVEVQMYGHIHEDKWVNTHKLLAVPHDVPIPGYKNGVIGCLRLWKAKATKELSFDMFNTGDYVRAVEEKNKGENITRVLYPDDRTRDGKELRLKQEYFLVAASIRDILNRFLDHQSAEENSEEFDYDDEQQLGTTTNTLQRRATLYEDPKKVIKFAKSLATKVAIQLNDTHPSLAIPELLRILMDEYTLEWSVAWPIVRKCFYYTNHTVLPEALEKWPVEMLNHVLPRHLQIIYLINSTHLANVRVAYPDAPHLVREMSIIEECGAKSVRMAYLSIVGSSRVNGVAKVHSQLIRNTLFQNFVNFYADKNHFTNVTNGVTPRRWLVECNPELAELITSSIGDAWPANLTYLSKLGKFKTDSAFLAKLKAVKEAKKEQFKDFIASKYQIRMNSKWMLSVQVKRIHEYKRQLMNVLNVIVQFSRAMAGKPMTPKTFVIGGKAAPGYQRAKKIIKLINKVSKTIDREPKASKYLKLIMLPNYDVSTAEIVIPAADLSEQISLAGMEASGTGNMKFMMNGALTIGTLDGANFEIAGAVDRTSMFAFGMKIEEVPEARRTYNADRYRIIEENTEIKQALNLISSGYFFPENPDYFQDIVHDLWTSDYYMLIKDLTAYIEAEDEASRLYYASQDQGEWYKASLDNIASSGIFSSDESIKNYADNIWSVKYSDRSTQQQHN